METQKQKRTILSSPKVDNSLLLLDATILIKALKHKLVRDFLEDLRDNHNCDLYTIPEVVFEVARGAVESEEDYERANNFCEEMQIAVLNIDRQLTYEQRDKMQKFSYRYAFLARKASCTDYKLCLTVYRFPNFKLISANTKDIPQELFNPLGAVVTNVNNSICTDVVYELKQ